MTQEDKELLFKDLSTRLPHHVKVKVWLKDGTTEEGPLDLEHNYGDVLQDAFYFGEIKDIKPYLRPMSSMTKEECRQLSMLLPSYYCVFQDKINITTLEGKILPEHIEIITDFYNSHYLDFRYLIPKGLALKAKKSMYKFKD